MIKTRHKLARYSGSLAIVLGVHAIAVLLTLNWSVPQAIELPPAAMVVELAPLPEPAPVVPEPALSEFVAPEPVAPRRVADFAANDRQPVSVAGELSEQAAIAELAQLYREMGDSEMADTLLRDAGLLEAPKEAVDGS